MCGSSTAAKSLMAQFEKSQTPQELWKSSLKAKDPLKPDEAKTVSDPPSAAQPVQAAKPLGIGVLLDRTA
jgi:hypothetical protein